MNLTLLALSHVLAWALVICCLCVLAALYWAVGQVSARSSTKINPLVTDDGPDIGGRFPQSDLIPVSINLRTAILILGDECEPCAEIARRLPSLEVLMPPDFTLVIVWEGEHAFSLLKERDRRKLQRVNFIYDPQHNIRTQLNIDRIPFGIAVNQYGYVESKGVVNTVTQVEGLFHGRGFRPGTVTWTAHGADA